MFNGDNSYSFRDHIKSSTFPKKRNRNTFSQDVMEKDFIYFGEMEFGVQSSPAIRRRGSIYTGNT